MHRFRPSVGPLEAPVHHHRHLDRRPAGQQHPRRHRRVGLGPRPGLTVRLPAPPPSLAPRQAHRPPETLQIPVRHQPPVLGLSPRPARPAARHRRRGLHRHCQLARPGLGYRQDPESVQAEQCLSQPSTVTHAGVSSSLAAFRQPQRWRDPCHLWWTLSYPSLPTPLRRAAYGGFRPAATTEPPPRPGTDLLGSEPERRTGPAAWPSASFVDANAQ